MPFFLVDFQYYPSGDDRVLKEATLLDIASKKRHHYTFKSPISLDQLSKKDRCTAYYIHNHLGVLDWSCGRDSIEDFIHSIPGNSVLMCNGGEKMSILRRILPHIYHIIDMQIVLPADKKQSCSFPADHSLCSMTNVCKLYDYFN